MADQPFYHKAVILFTAKEDISAAIQKDARFAKAIERLLQSRFGDLCIVAGSVEVDDCDAEPGDPSDL